MMSVLVRQILPNSKGPLLLFTKGADSVIKERCAQAYLREEDILDFANAD